MRDQNALREWVSNVSGKNLVFGGKSSGDRYTLSGADLRLIFLEADDIDYQGGPELFSGYQAELCIINEGNVAFFSTIQCTGGEVCDVDPFFFVQTPQTRLNLWFESFYCDWYNELLVRAHFDYKHPGTGLVTKKFRTFTYTIDERYIHTLKIPI